MFNETIYMPNITDDKTIIEFTKDFILDRNSKITVPNQYTAVVFDNEKISFRIEPCVKKSIYKEYGKNLLGHTLKIAFIHTKAIPEEMWGFGNIQVNNERLKEAYRAGTHGTYKLKITDYTKFVNSFLQNENVTVSMVKEKVLSIIKTIGIPLVSKCFANTQVSVFEIDALVEDIRKDLQQKLKEEKILIDLGLEINAITVEGIYINEDDLEIIRDRLNG